MARRGASTQPPSEARSAPMLTPAATLDPQLHVGKHQAWAWPRGHRLRSPRPPAQVPATAASFQAPQEPPSGAGIAVERALNPVFGAGPRSPAQTDRPAPFPRMPLYHGLQMVGPQRRVALAFPETVLPHYSPAPGFSEKLPTEPRREDASVPTSPWKDRG